jgi:complement component 1 Q subcomponent-binding protein, mitochondrial
MVFLRQLSRSIPRTISRSIPVAARFSTTTLAARLSRPAIPSLVTRTLSQQKYPAFSTGRILKEPAGECMSFFIIGGTSEEMRPSAIAQVLPIGS